MKKQLKRWVQTWIKSTWLCKALNTRGATKRGKEENEERDEMV